MCFTSPSRSDGWGGNEGARVQPHSCRGRPGEIELVLRGDERRRDQGRLSAEALLHVDDGECVVHPETETAMERAHPREALPLQLQRHPGARRFLRSGAVQDELAAARELAMSSRDVLGGNPERARDGIRRGGHVQHGASVDDGERLVTDVETTLELLGRDLRDPETAEKPPALDELDAHVSGERRPDYDDERVAEASGP